MSRPDAERALNIYKTFGRQTDQVVQYLTVARQYESLTRLEVPKLKHAPTTLTSSLEEYLNDPDFDINRRQYLAQAQGTKGTSKPVFKSEAASTPFDKAKKSDSSFPAQTKPSAQAPAEVKGPAPDLIDFFDSIEQNQQPMAQPNVASQPFANGYPQAQQYQQTGFAPQQTGYNPFLPNQQQTVTYAQPMPQQQQPQLLQQPQPQLQQQPQPLQPDFTGAGFGGYTPQPQQQPQQQPSQYSFQSTLSSIPQNGLASFDQQQQQQQYQQSPQQIQPQPTSSNPFRQSLMPTGASINPALSSSPSTRQSTNPFAKNLDPQPTSSFSSSASPFPSSNSPFISPPAQTQQQELQQNSSFFSPPQSSLQTQTLQPQRTGTNPFARNRSPVTNVNPVEQQQQRSTPLLATATGSTNPFRQSQFVNQPTGLGWQNVPGSQGTFGGYDVNRVETVPIFPRPGAS
jgi:phosphatidylinositol-binding clathrin assembly protein